MNQVEQYYTLAQVGLIYRVTVRTVQRWIDLGEQTAGKRGLYPVAHLPGRGQSSDIVRVPASAIVRLSLRHTT